MYTKKMNTYEELMQVVKHLDERFPGGCEIFQRVSRLVEETGELAQMVNHIEGMGIKHEKYGPPDKEKLAKEVQDVMRAALGIAKHYQIEELLEQSIHLSYKKSQKGV